MDFTKVEAGKLDLVVVDFDVEQAVRDVLRTLALRAREKGLRLALDVAPGVPRFVAGDDQRLRQVDLNLVGNAIKFTASGEIRVEVRLESGETRLPRLEFVVADTGVGVRPEKRDVIFAPFEQEDDSTTRKYGGTGLGLAICTKLVAIPAIAGPAPENLRVLLAEDNPVNRILAIREKEKTSGGHVPIVALTANAMRGDGDLCLAQGMDAYLAKPFQIADLDRVLGEVTGAAARPM